MSGLAFSAGPGWYSNVTVTRIVVVADGGINVAVLPALSACVSQSGYGPAYASVLPSHPGINRILAELTAAYIAGKQVSLHFTDNKCVVNEMILGTQ